MWLCDWAAGTFDNQRQMRRVVNISATIIGMLAISFAEPYKLFSTTTYLRYAMALHSSVHILTDWVPQTWPLCAHCFDECARTHCMTQDAQVAQGCLPTGAFPGPYACCAHHSHPVVRVTVVIVAPW